MPASADQRTARRPQLLVLVYGVFLLLVGITASALVSVTTNNVRTSLLQDVAQQDLALVRLVVNDLNTDDLSAGAISADRAAGLQRELGALFDGDGILRIALIDHEGRIVASNVPGLRGSSAPHSPALTAALAGVRGAPMLEPGSSAQVPGPDLWAPQVLGEVLPLTAGQDPLGAIALWRNATPALAEVERQRNDVLLVTMVAALLLAAVLFLIFRAAQGRLGRQHDQLVEATQLDALTGLLNHGAVVSLLAAAVERSTRRDDRIGVALIDIDNFRLLNDTHSHEAGDEVLLRVAELLPVGGREHDHAARYGPDELLLVREGATPDEMEALVTDLRQRLAEVQVQFGDSELLPVTVSVGIGVLPEHASSVTDLLAVSAAALAEAKGGGGDSVRIAQRTSQSGPPASFNVFQGLVIAVDRKDHYTRRHSEDVSRYAVFLGRQLELDEQALRSLHLSGLLHDVGKIAIPDTILRKPGRLTSAEYEIFKQHVALGDSIVRDVPDIDAVRSGIRTHHERWDGRGYLGGLEGEEIPLIGRIMAVADAFSAMTTSRPYRKALDVTEALKRLGDAAGTQLEESLVEAFIAGIESAPDAPMPNDDAAVIWLPEMRVA
jgi:diguanylate cyclase (GGDEF)-like protein